MINQFLIGFCAVVISVLLWPVIPPLFSLPLVGGSAILVAKCITDRYLPVKPLFCGCFLGFCWVTAYCHLLDIEKPIYSNLPAPTKKEPYQLQGEIISLVSVNSDWIRMDIKPEQKNSWFLPTKHWRLTWRNPSKSVPLIIPKVGEKWDFLVKVKPPTFVLNQGGFNQQKYFTGQRIFNHGKVITGKQLAKAVGVRARLINQLKPVLEKYENGDILLALTLGDRSLFSTTRWQHFRQSGTGHLVAISGLHLSVVAWWCYWFVFYGFNRFCPTSGLRNLKLAAISALCIAIGYAYLAGFAVATQRALLMLFVFFMTSLTHRFSLPWERLLWALFVILIFDPLASLSSGFWLSFMALAFIFIGLSQSNLELKSLKTEDSSANLTYKLMLWIKQFTSLQWRLCLGLALLQGILFGGMTIHSLWINLILVPYFSFIVIPLALLTLILWIFVYLIYPSLSHHLWQLVDLTLWFPNKIWLLTDNLFGTWITLPHYLIVSCLFAIFAWWLWRKLPQLSIVSLLLVMPLLFNFGVWSGLFKSKDWQLHLLDVGQGLAVVIQKGNRGILYDTGAAYGQKFSYAERVIVPFLAAKGIWNLDYLIVSHGDNDHAGGTDFLVNSFEPMQLITDTSVITSRYPLKIARGCAVGEMNWQGLNFKFIGAEHVIEGNNGSCVVQVSDNYQRILFTGDIERAGEVKLLKSGYSLKSDILIVPHHGSRTSSNVEFIAAVAPDVALFPAGFNNRWHFPKTDIVERYARKGIATYITGDSGQITVNFANKDYSIWRYREELAPFWYNQISKLGVINEPE